MSDELLKFINLVEENECLYKNNLQEYSNKNATEKAWTGIAQKMNWSVTFCKEKWRNIRNGFVRSLKPSLSGSSSSHKKKYYLHDLMGFVLPYVKPVQNAEQAGNIILSDLDEHHLEVVDARANAQESSEASNTNCTEDISFCKEKKKKKRKCSDEHGEVEKAVLGYIQEKKARETQDNSRKMFLLSLLPDLNNLSDKQFRQFKIRSMLLAEELINEGQGSADQHCVQPLQSHSCRFVSNPVPSAIAAPTPTTIIHSTASDNSESYTEWPDPLEEDSSQANNQYRSRSSSIEVKSEPYM